jgi:hypothetical protein
MTTDLPASPTSPLLPPDSPPGPRRAIHAVVAWLLALGALLSLTGLGWDVQWHNDVGPDTFFTLPHLVMYSGVAIAGLTCLVVSLRILISERAAGAHPSLSPIPWPILMTGFGAALFLLFGLWDQWWHTIFGFDVTIESPPHIGLLTGIQITTLGAMVAFAASSFGGPRAAVAPRTGGSRDLLNGRSVGVAVTAAISAMFLTTFLGLAASLIPADSGVDPIRVYLAMVFVGAMVTAAAATRTVLAATLVAAVVVLVKVLLGWLTVPATDWYASSLGLFVRDDVLAGPRFPALAVQLPFVILLAGILIDALVSVGVSHRLPGRWVVAVAGATAGLLTGAGYPVGLPDIFGGPASVATVLVLGVAGAVTALVAWSLGNLARAVR